ncbi:MAG: Transcriptional regulator, MarR family [Sphaerisporangium sp.]|jgi:DNA-binding MarR family transcriptional regulator|nr:Transcriptional regulator, MarR family [Sphaerisporangium sp.]
MSEEDHVEGILAAWRTVNPELDLMPVGIFARITRIERYKTRALRDMYRRHGLDAGEYDVLAALRRANPDHQLTPTALYRSMLVTSATMTERLDRLERRQLIRRHRLAAGDRRSVQVGLTTAGLHIIDQAYTDLVATEAALLDDLPEPDRETLATLLARLSTNLERRDTSH